MNMFVTFWMKINVTCECSMTQKKRNGKCYNHKKKPTAT